MLNSHGASLGVDGDFGPGTLSAVESYQSGAGLAVDGIVGPNTKAALTATGGTVPPPSRSPHPRVRPISSRARSAAASPNSSSC
nr:peptidoglycan-binding domain-containing protein [Streptacidiphilus sp. PB12-B1b]